MIKGLILDVDGVLVGGKSGYNWPETNPEVLRTLKILHAGGIPVVLCTGKGTFAITDIVKKAHLDNPHIGDGGAIISDVLGGKIIRQHVIEKTVVPDLIRKLQNVGCYLELYTKDGYFIQSDSVGDETEKHEAILGKKPEMVSSLVQICATLDLIKIMPVVVDAQIPMVETIVKNNPGLFLQWGRHGSAPDYNFGIITNQGISKRQSVIDVSKFLKIPLENLLGVGDQMTDWGFMEICGYAGAMGNGVEELKEKMRMKGSHGVIGKTVDENGLLDILTHFQVI